jgi:sulfate permease, SulP family
VARTRSGTRLKSVFPLLAQLKTYQSEWLSRDIMAGLAIAAVALPIGIAYPAIAGLPVEMGLYASILALLGYALFGSSRQLIVGPDAATLTVLAASLAQLAIAGTAARAVMAAAFAVVVGVLCLLAAICRLGFIANFLSRPVLVGYLCGISLALFVGQIGRLTTVSIEHTGLVRPLIELGRKASSIHLPTLATGAGIFLLLRVLRRIAPRAPGPLVALALAIVLSMAFDLQSYGIALLGRISAALPSFAVPIPTTDMLDDLALSAVGLLVVSFGSGIITARSFGAKNRYRVDANRELVGFAAANIASGLFGGFPVTGADSRTAVNDAVGGRTQLAGLVAAAALLLVLTALTGVLQYLPIAALGAVLASAAIDLFDGPELRRLWRTSRAEFTFAMIAMAGVVGLGVLKGVIAAIGATGIYLLARVSRPSDALLGRVPGKDGLYKLHREPRAKPIPGLAVYLVQGDLVFFNADYLRQRIRWIVDRLPGTTQWFILDAGAIPTIDSTAAGMLEDIRVDLGRRHIRFGIAGLHSQPRKLISRAGLSANIGSDMLFVRAEDAAAAFDKAQLSPVAAETDAAPLPTR